MILLISPVLISLLLNFKEKLNISIRMSKHSFSLPSYTSPMSCRDFPTHVLTSYAHPCMQSDDLSFVFLFTCLLFSVFWTQLDDTFSLNATSASTAINFYLSVGFPHHPLKIFNDTTIIWG